MTLSHLRGVDPQAFRLFVTTRKPYSLAPVSRELRLPAENRANLPMNFSSKLPLLPDAGPKVTQSDLSHLGATADVRADQRLQFADYLNSFNPPAEVIDSDGEAHSPGPVNESRSIQTSPMVDLPSPTINASASPESVSVTGSADPIADYLPVAGPASEIELFGSQIHVPEEITEQLVATKLLPSDVTRLQETTILPQSPSEAELAHVKSFASVGNETLQIRDAQRDVLFESQVGSEESRSNHALSEFHPDDLVATNGSEPILISNIELRVSGIDPQLRERASVDVELIEQDSALPAKEARSQQSHEPYQLLDGLHQPLVESAQLGPRAEHAEQTDEINDVVSNQKPEPNNDQIARLSLAQAEFDGSRAFGSTIQTFKPHRQEPLSAGEADSGSDFVVAQSVPIEGDAISVVPSLIAYEQNSALSQSGVTPESGEIAERQAASSGLDARVLDSSDEPRREPLTDARTSFAPTTLSQSPARSEFTIPTEKTEPTPNAAPNRETLLSIPAAEFGGNSERPVRSFATQTDSVSKVSAPGQPPRLTPDVAEPSPFRNRLIGNGADGGSQSRHPSSLKFGDGQR